MGLQLIFAVETNSKCKSDWIYIKDTIEHFYKYDRTQVKFSPVYMDGKGRYEKQEREISSLISQYAATSKENRSKVIYCFDCDDYDIKQEDLRFLDDAKRYCRERDAEFVWFCKDIERVYLGKKVDNIQKKKESAAFKVKKLIEKVDGKKLTAVAYKANTSNILTVLDRYLERKFLHFNQNVL